MPVLVTGGQTATGRATARELLRAGGEVRLWVPDAVDPAVVGGLRGRGYKLARGDLDDEGRLELALEQVHTVVHASTSLSDEPSVVLDDLASVLSAAIGAGCRRLVWFSHLLVDHPEGNPWLAACADGETLLREAPLEAIIFRTGLVYAPGDPLTRQLVAGLPPALTAARHAPLFVDDLAEAVRVADRDRSDLADLTVVVPMVGPQVMTLADLARVLGPLRAPANGAVAGAGGTGLPPHAVEVLARDALGPPEALGRSGTPPAAAAQLVRAAG